MSVLTLINQPNLIQSVPAQSLLPVQQIPRAIAAKIEDSHGKLVAIGALIRCTNNQAYFVLQHLDSVLGKKAITVFTPDDEKPFNLKVKNVFEQSSDRSFLPMYIQVHFNPEERLPVEHLIDLLAENTLGNHNLELRKNITMDMLDSDGDAFLRDKAGFIVSDKMFFEQISASKSEFFQTLPHFQESDDLKYEEITDKNTWKELLGYDSTLSSHNRSDFLQFIFSKNRVYAAKTNKKEQQQQQQELQSLPSVEEEEKLTSKGVQKKETDSETKKKTKTERNEIETKKSNTVAGYMVVSQNAGSKDDQILCLYATEKAIAERLLRVHLMKTQAQNIILCTSCDNWNKIRSLKSFKRRPIYRRHTRTVPGNIKWEEIFAINVGMNLF